MNRMVPKLPDSVELVELRVGDPAALTRLSEQRLPSRSFKIVAAASVELCCQNPLDEGVGGEFVGIRHRSIFGSREPGVPRDVVAMA